MPWYDGDSPHLGLKSEFSQHVGLIQLCNRTTVNTAVPVYLPHHSSPGVTGRTSKMGGGGSLGVGRTRPTSKLDKPYLPNKFPFTL